MKVLLGVARVGVLSVGLTLCWISASGLMRSQDPDLIPANCVAVAFSGELEGSLTPCGCSKPMMGGIPRRGSFLAATDPKNALVRIESGDFTNSLGRQDEIKAETILELLNTLHYDAIGLGEEDFRLGVPYLQSLQGRFQGAFLCANARTTAGSAIFGESAFLARQVSGRQIRIGIVGLLSDQFAGQLAALDPNVEVEAPQTALERLTPALRAKADVRILLYHGPRSEAEDLARVEGGLFQLVLYCHEGDEASGPETVGGTTFAGGGKDGKQMSIAILEGTPPSRVQKIDVRTLDPSLADDPAIMSVMHAYLGRIAAENLLTKVPKTPTSNGDSYAASASCAPCHKEANAIWAASGHAHALHDLAEQGHDQDPECVKCHVVGLEHKSGFSSHAETPWLENVGCESCHGPSARHVNNPAIKLDRVGADTCENCHDPSHSPAFNFETFWPKIKH